MFYRSFKRVHIITKFLVLLLATIVLNVNAKSTQQLEEELVNSFKKICNTNIEILNQKEVVIRSIYSACEVLRLLGEERNLKNHAVAHISVINKHYSPLKLYYEMDKINHDEIFAEQLKRSILKYQKKTKDRNFVPKSSLGFYLSDVQENTDRPITQIEKELLIEGINIGISKETLSNYVRSTKKAAHPKWEIPSYAESFFNGVFSYGFQSSPYFVSSNIKKENKLEYYKYLGIALTWGKSERHSFCLSYSSINDGKLIEFDGKVLSELSDKKLITFIQYINLYHFCDSVSTIFQSKLISITKNIMDSDSYKSLSKEEKDNYIALVVSKLLDEIKDNKVRSDFYNKTYHKYLALLASVKKHYEDNTSTYYNITFIPELLFTLEQFSEISAVSDDFLGLAIVTAAVNEVVRNLLDDYIINDSDDLRNLQSTLESIIVNIYVGAILHKPIKGELKRSESQFKILEEMLNLIISGHNPILNNNFRERVLRGNEVKNYNIYTSELMQRKKTLNNSVNLIDFIGKKQSPLTSAALPIFNPFIATTKLDQLEGIPFNYINIVAGNIGIVSVELPSNSSINPKLTSIHDLLDIVKMVKEDIKENNQLSLNAIKNICDSLSPFHKKIALTVNSSDKLLLTPSVNLFPIPFGLIIGNECENSDIRDDLSIVLVNDYLAAEEFAAFNESPVDSFIGIANPMINANSAFNIDIGEWRSLDVLSENNTLNLDELPLLPDAEVEVSELSRIYSNQTVYLGNEASIADALQKAEGIANNNKKKLLTIATHGFAADTGGELTLPTLLNINNGNLELFTFLDVYDYNLRGSIVVLSACDTASGFIDSSDKLFTGFVKSFGDVGANFIVSSLWPVNSKASKDISLEFGIKIKNGSFFDALSSANKKIEHKKYRLPFVFTYL